MNRVSLIIAIFILSTTFAFAQGTSKVTRSFENPIIVDSNSTLLIPIVYNIGLFASSKINIWDDVYSNIIFYNFKTDSSKKLFEKDTYVLSFNRYNYSYKFNEEHHSNITHDWVFYKVMNVDRNQNNNIDSEDPVILYVSDVHGNNLKKLTLENENVSSFIIYEKQNIAMVKIQRDVNNDDRFDKKDTNFYVVKLDLSTLTWGNKIELN